ncbi:hypothetical protein FUSPEROL_00602 [Fusobacterium periodonticum ATCC 33693]|uniref:Uncharacterized protein n=1 Tax=Fusobacterium periodonticum ATCC 33693 TaxID=546275 RepID=D4CT90_9FUSO|nr:hypothetical protein FUSPEROL_00602 [Fusobacterium periodonticum ATCC 33693]
MSKIKLAKEVFKFQYDNTLSLCVTVFPESFLLFKFQYDNTLSTHENIIEIICYENLNSNMIIL